MTTRTLDRCWTVDDESICHEYEFRVYYQVEPLDSGDGTTPAHGGGITIDSIQVTRVSKFDDSGELLLQHFGNTARQFENQAWRLLDADPFLRQQIKSECAAADSHAGVVAQPPPAVASFDRPAKRMSSSANTLRHDSQDEPSATAG